MGSEIQILALAGAGVFTVALGLVHFVIPLLMDFEHAIPAEEPGSPALRTLGVGRLRYQVLRSDVRGIGWVMSNAAAYVLITVGVIDLLAASWVGTDIGRVFGAWAGGWWALRAAGQFVVGRRVGDILVAGWFTVLAAVHAAAVVA